MEDYLKFRKMITPIAIQVIFWLGIAGIVIAGLGVMITENFFAGLGFLIVVPIVWRIYCEILLIIFRIYDRVAAIADS
jgi:hypothetical protein